MKITGYDFNKTVSVIQSLILAKERFVSSMIRMLRGTFQLLHGDNRVLLVIANQFINK